MPKTHTKDPQAILDYSVDWSGGDGTPPWLHEGEGITSATWSVTARGPGAVTIDREGRIGGKCTVWLAGGTPGVTSIATCHIVTSEGREDDRSHTIRVANR